MNNKTPPHLHAHNSSKPKNSSGSGLSLYVLLFLAFSAVYLLIVNILGKIGVGDAGLFAMVIVVPVAILVITGITTRVLSSDNFDPIFRYQRAGGAIGPVNNALAGSAEWLSLFFVVGIIASFANTDHDGAALILGTFLGLVFMAIFILPAMSRRSYASIAGEITANTQTSQIGHKAFRLATAVLAIICALLFLVAQIGAGSHVLIVYFPMPIYWASICLVVPLMITVLAGGLRGLTIANMMLYWVIAAAILLPAIWLSVRITGNPIPQFSYGTGALQPIIQLEEQLINSTSGKLNFGFEQGNFGGFSGLADFLATALCMMAGTAAMPLIYSRIICASGSPARVRTIGWMLVFIAFLISAIPAFIIFMKFEIYRDLVGLRINQLDLGIEWLMSWASLEGGHHALICGKPALSIQAITAACADNPNHVLMPSDLRFSPLMTLLGAGEIADMPMVYSAIAFAGVLSVSVTTAGIALMVIVNTLDEQFIFARSNATDANNKPTLSAPIARRLFVSRILLIVLVISAIWISQVAPVPVTDYSLWAFALAASAIFPVWMLAIWWKSATNLGLLAGLISGSVATTFSLLTLEYGADWIARSGDEPVWLMPFSGVAIKPLHSGLIGLLLAIIVIIVISLTEQLITKWRASKQVQTEG